MTLPLDRERCSSVWHQRGQPTRCTRRGAVERDGKLWCRQHDPEAAEERMAARKAAWRAKRDAPCFSRQRAERIRLAERAVIEAARAYARTGLMPHTVIDAVRALDEAEAAGE